MTKVVYFQPAYNGDFQDTLENAKAAAPYVDHFVVVADASKYHEFSHDQKLELQNVGTNVVRVDFDWEESLPKMYQHGVQAALELKADWICFSDADEHFNEAFFKDLKSKLIPSLEQKGYDMAGIKCHAQFAIADAVWPSSLSVETTAGVMDLDKVPEKVVVTNDHKYMLMKLYPDLKWKVSAARRRCTPPGTAQAIPGKRSSYRTNTGTSIERPPSRSTRAQPATCSCPEAGRTSATSMRCGSS